MPGESPTTVDDLGDSCAFSFSKKPIDSSVLPLRSTISNILPVEQEKHKKSNSITGDIVEPVKNLPKLISNNIDYNEQIRAPRFNFFNQTLDIDGKESDTTSEIKQGTEAKNDADNSGDDSKLDNYVPANFDLNNYTYATSVADESSNASTTNLVDAINNLNDNLTTFERDPTNNTTNFIKPVYRYKRPLSIPAVLRAPELAPNSSSSSFNINQVLLKLDLPINETFPSEIQSDPNEPTHNHWKPNNFTQCCMKCFKGFGNFFNMRRHHCRFCGFLICSSCLFDKTFQGENLKLSSNAQLVYLDSEARFVVPIFKNLSHSNIDVANLNKAFKSCKICKTCGDYYLNVLFHLNNWSAPTSNSISSNLPFVIVDNPFLNKKNENIELREPSSYTPKLNEWTWSSF